MDKDSILLPATTTAKNLGLAKAEQIRKNGARHNSLRAFESDMRYFWAWGSISHDIEANTVPIHADIIECFVGDHLQQLEPSVETVLRSRGFQPKDGRHKLSTVKRRLSSLAKWHRLHGFDRKTVYTMNILQTLRAAAESEHSAVLLPQKKQAITLEIYRQLILVCDPTTLIGARDRALLSVALFSGGRRRSELCQMEMQSLSEHTESLAPYYSYTFTLPFTKSHYAIDGVPTLPIKGEAAEHLKHWLRMSAITEGFVFRSVDPRNQKIRTQISGESIRKRLKAISDKAGLSHLNLSPHSLRSGFVTECAHAGIPMERGMAMSLHKTAAAYLSYSREGDALNNPAANLFTD